MIFKIYGTAMVASVAYIVYYILANDLASGEELLDKWDTLFGGLFVLALGVLLLTVPALLITFMWIP